MKKLFTVLALCASVMVASATDGPKGKAASKAPAKKETCSKGHDCCKKAGVASAKKAADKKELIGLMILNASQIWEAFFFIQN